MISEDMQQVILGLLAERRKDGIRKFSQRRIAWLTDVSRGAVGTIKKRGYVRKKKRIRYPKEGWPPKIERCERCGTMALANEPCVECRLRHLHKQIKPVEHPPSDIVLELRPVEQARYERLREWQAEQRAITADCPDSPPAPDLDPP